MNKILKNLHIAFIPMLFLITLIYSIVFACMKSDSQNWYSFAGQFVLVIVWIGGNLGFKKLLKNKVVSIVLANVIFQVLLYIHMWVYLIIEMIRQASDFEFVKYLVFVYICISFIAIIVMTYDLVKSVTDANLLKKDISIESNKVKILNLIFLTLIPFFGAWEFFYSILLLSYDMRLILLNGFAVTLLIATWLTLNLVLGKSMKNKKMAVIIPQIVIQSLILLFMIFSIVIVVFLPFASEVSANIIALITQIAIFLVLSISAIVVMLLQFKLLKNIPPKPIETVASLEPVESLNSEN